MGGQVVLSEASLCYGYWHGARTACGRASHGQRAARVTQALQAVPHLTFIMRIMTMPHTPHPSCRHVRQALPVVGCACRGPCDLLAHMFSLHSERGLALRCRRDSACPAAPALMRYLAMTSMRRRPDD